MLFSKLNDESLASHMQQNNGEGIDVLIDRYQERLLRYASSFTRDADRAEDIVQESFISVYKNINSFDVRRKFSSWIYRIVHNRAISELRKNSTFFGLNEALEVPDASSDALTLGKELDRQKARQIITEKFKRLPIKYREVLVLRYIEDRSYEEISDILKIPKNTAGVRIKRGLEKLKTIININPEDYL